MRDGETFEIPATQVVPGDVIGLGISGSASAVAADARVLEAHDLYTLESSLTGESKPVQKSVIAATESNYRFPQNMVYAGTAVMRGRGRAVVIRTGMRTELGAIASTVARRDTRVTDLKREVRLIAIILFVASVVLVVVVFASNRFHLDSPDAA